MPHTAPVQTVAVGDMRVTYLPDGGGALAPTALYPGTTDEQWRAYARYLGDNGGVITTVGGYLIEAGDRKMIVDTGLGPVQLEFPGFGPMYGGHYLDSFARTGVAREEVTDVIFTHLHLDHVGWTTVEENGKRALLFPNARYFVNRTEWDAWQDSDNPAGPHPEYVVKPLAPIVRFVAGGDEVAPGVALVDTPGHTPGHMSLILSSGGERLILTADLLHCPAQVTERSWCVAFDMDPEQAIASRERMYPELVRPGTLAAVNHFSEQVFGHFSQEGDAYRWTPIG